MPNPLQPSFRLPFNVDGKAAPEVVAALRWHDNSLVDLNQAIKALKSQLDAKTITTATTSSSSSGGGVTPIPTPFAFPGLGAVRDETGSTSYATLQADNGILLILSDASPVAVTLNSALVTPYFLFATNFGAGLVTFTPTSGLINGAASYTLADGFFVEIVFDGVNWKTSAVVTIPVLPTFVDADIPTPATDGVTTVFTLPGGAPNPAKSLILALGGLTQDQGAGLDYTLSGATITYGAAPAAGLKHVAWFRK